MKITLEKTHGTGAVETTTIDLVQLNENPELPSVPLVLLKVEIGELLSDLADIEPARMNPTTKNFIKLLKKVE